MKIPPSGLRGMALREAAQDLRAIIELVRNALDAKVNSNAGPGTDRKWFELEAVYGDTAVICMDGRHWSYPYTMTANVVTLADPVEVVETFVPLKEAAVTTEIALVESESQAAGTVWEATLIQAGMSVGSRVFYSDQVLREAAHLFEGVRICIKPDAKHIKATERDINTLVGWGEAPRFVEGATPDTGRLVAMLNLPGLPETTAKLLAAAARAGKQNIVGLSIDARGQGAMRMIEGKRVNAATSIDRIESVDLIVEPGAGGRLIRLVEAAPENGSTQGDPDMNLRQKMLRLVEAKTPAAYAKLDPETVSDDDLELAYREALTTTAAPAGNAAADAEERIRMIEARMLARSAIDGSSLPQPAKDRLTRVFATRERFVEADVTAAIAEEREYLSRFVESGRVNMGDFDIEVGDRSAKVKDMLDAFFDTAHKDHRSAQSFKECYIEITGDKRVTGHVRDCDMSRLRESLGTNFREAALDTTSFAQVLGDSITRRTLADFRTHDQFDVWRDLVNIVPVTDFRTQHRTRWGGFGDLPIVAEKGDYTELAQPDDEEATYSARKRGGVAAVTLEMTRNDDVSAIRQIPTRLSRASKRTLGKFVLDFIRANGAIYDGKALFHADHGNLGTTAFSAAAWSEARLAMMAQAEYGAPDAAGIPPAHVWIPAALEELAYNTFKNRGTSNDQNFAQSTAPMIHPVWYWTDANDWACSADKLDIPSIELGFLDGREEPELFVQDSPTVGSLFANDVITYKIRHIYGGAVTDYRGLRKHVVA